MKYVLDANLHIIGPNNHQKAKISDFKEETVKIFKIDYF